MAWLDDRIWAHPKIARLSDPAFRAWVSSVCYSSGFGTRGRLEREHQKLIGATTRSREELLSCGLWIDAGSEAIEIRDWQEHNDRMDERRARDRERKRLARLSNGTSAEMSADCPRTIRPLGVTSEE